MRQILLIIACFLCCNLSAQKLSVESMTALPMDVSASQYERKDLNGQPCALVKVQLATMGARFEGNVVGSADYKTGEYWVYMTEGSYMLSVKHPNFVTLSVNFRDYGISGVQGKATYRLTLLMPQAAGVVQTQKLTINYTPTNAMVLIDSKPYKGAGRLEVSLPIGNHSYIIAAEGYATAEGTVKLNTDAPRTVNETLVATIQKEPTLTTHPVVTTSNPGQDTSSQETSSKSLKSVTGYRVQVFKGGNSRSERLQAEKIGKEIKSHYSDLPVYVHYYSPQWICRVGNYQTYEEAYQMLLSLRKLGYSEAIIVKGKIKVPK